MDKQIDPDSRLLINEIFSNALSFRSRYKLSKLKILLNLASEALRVSLYDITFHYLCFIGTALRKSSVVFDVVELSVCRRDSLSYVT